MLKIAAYQNVNLPERVQKSALSSVRTNRQNMSGQKVDFKSTLNAALDQSQDVHFSAHAKARLHSRGVQLDKAKIDALAKAITKAEAKGARESLVLSDEAAYVVSVSTRTVITAFDRDNLRDGVFTSIDSAVIL
jgi:flagellar operon protein